ncbi:extracellular solute-binding protein [Saccharothrix sp. S26]|uniref:extracellular solute-binding protein n=1 Tax=Saccharothrix sp. S26 TaxID=2907215 RepID=UPI001F488380|nr:extracellular solute-binding protein [Saccharothrix sp. S26]MCE6995542.1 extracellular solute-binding protein [Saccharothrix sp. S26]
MSVSPLSGIARRRFLAATAVAAAGVVLAACGTAGPGGEPAAGTAALTMWALNDQTVLKASVDAYNTDHPDAKIDLQLYANDDYKQKIRVAFGAGQAPDLFFNWGGGGLRDYVKAGKVAEVPTAVDADRFTPSVLKTATFDGKLYGVPCNGLAPVVLYYNKKVLADAGLQPPKTWDDLLAAVGTLKGKGITPISLAAGSKWPTLMWEEYLLDRVGGADLFSAVEAGDSTAWTKPAVTEANKLLRELVDAGAFGDSASSLTYDQGASTALVYTGKAAMELMGTWEYANFAKAAPDFVKSDLGYTTFPTVPGGAGEEKAIVGNPSNFLSVNAASSTEKQAAAAEYLSKYVLNTDQVAKFLDSGTVPPVMDLERTLQDSTSPDKDWMWFVYDLVNEAPTFQLSWDQALPSTSADPLLTNIDKVFLGQLEPERFGQEMSKVAGS